MSGVSCHMSPSHVEFYVSHVIKKKIMDKMVKLFNGWSISMWPTPSSFEAWKNCYFVFPVFFKVVLSVINVTDRPVNTDLLSLQTNLKSSFSIS